MRLPVAPDRVVWRMAQPLAAHFDHQHLYAAYARAHFFYERACYRLEEGGSLRFDRLLNLFAHKTWVAVTGATGLELQVLHRGGSARLSLLAYDGTATRLVAAVHLEAAADTRVTRLRPPAGPPADILFLQIDAEAAVDVFDIAWVADEPPVRKAKVGVVITTFNRPQDVEPQVALLEGLERTGVDYAVLVVDNGENLKLARAYARTQVIPSPNLGGAGGFTRGLMELRARGDFTHALFMDDDAFCHPAAIERAAALVRYARKGDLAVTGAMNYLHAPHVQYELGGAVADYGVASIRQNADVNNLHELWRNEQAGPPAYGAWWCFLFPLAAVEDLPFPFFVRGDDIAFCLHNRFTLATLPGLTAWQPSFEYKIGAAIEYLAHRSFLALPLLDEGRNWSASGVMAGVRHAFASEVDGLRYPIAEAICHALEDVLTGAGFWRNAANTLARLQELGRMEAAFSQASFLPNWVFLPDDVEHRRTVRRLRARWGHLNLPARLCFRRPGLVNHMYPKRGQAAFRRGMIYYAPDGSRTLSCRRDWRWRRRLERRFHALAAEYEARFEALCDHYARERGELQSAKAWSARFRKIEPELRLAHPAV